MVHDRYAEPISSAIGTGIVLSYVLRKLCKKIATRVFIGASITFGILGILVVLIQPEDEDLLSKLLMIDVFVILPSFALSVAGKHLNVKS